MKTMQSTPRRRWFEKIDNGVGSALRIITIFCLVALFFLLLLNVISRYLARFSFGWFDEFVELSFAYFVFFGSAGLWREKEHFKLDFVKVRLQKTGLGPLWIIIIDAFSILFFVALCYYGMQLTVIAHETTPILRMPKKVDYVVIPISALIMLAYAVRDLIVDLRETHRQRSSE
jgi:TRAP-type C4-dicarboxylate transport system permease small subunit